MGKQHRSISERLIGNLTKLAYRQDVPLLHLKHDIQPERELINPAPLLELDVKHFWHRRGCNPSIDP
jgi:hypothetical protein